MPRPKKQRFKLKTGLKRGLRRGIKGTKYKVGKGLTKIGKTLPK